jgi:hypothetical protein
LFSFYRPAFADQHAIYQQAIDLERVVSAFGLKAAGVFTRTGDWVGKLSLWLLLILAVHEFQRAFGSYS